MIKRIGSLRIASGISSTTSLGSRPRPRPQASPVSKRGEALRPSEKLSDKRVHMCELLGIICTIYLQLIHL